MASGTCVKQEENKRVDWNISIASLSKQWSLTVSLRLREVVHVNSLGTWACQNFIPIEGSNVAEIVVVEEAHVTSKNVCNYEN